MTNVSTIENKISSIKKYLNIALKHKKHSRQEIEKDDIIRGAVERHLYLVAQACVDLAEAVIAFKEFRKPITYNEGFEILEEEGVIEVELKEKMARMAGFRNVVAHDYEKINYDIVYDILQNRLPDITEFVVAVRKYLKL